MADDSAALVVELTARFDKFEKAMKDVARVVDQQTKVIENRFDSLSKVISDKLGAIQGTLVGQIGVLGRALQALGPIGVAAAVGIGAIVVALNATAEAADRVGQKAVALKDFSNQTGFSIEEAQGLRKAMTAVGVDADQALIAISKFTVELNELRQKGSGPLVDALQTIDAGLVRTMLQTKTTAEAFRVFIDALSRMSTERRNALARQTGGRGGIGAFAEMAEDARKFFDEWEKGIASAKPAEEIKRVEEAYKRLMALQKQASSEWDKMFPTDEFVQARTRALENYIAAQKAVNEGRVGQAASTSVAGRIFTGLRKGESFSEILNADSLTLSGRIGDAIDDTRRKTELLKDSNKALADGLAAKVKVQQESVAVAKDEAQTTAGVTAGVERDVEARKARLAVVNTEVARLQQLKGVAGAGFAPRDESRLQQLLVEQRQLQTQRADPGLMRAQALGIQAITDAETARTVALRESLGVATQEQIVATKSIEINRALAQQQITQAEADRALLIAKKEALEKYEAQLVRASSLPGLTRLGLDLKDTTKIFDQFAVRSISTFTDAMADAITGTKSLGDAFREMTQSILKDIARIAIQQAVVKPLLGAIGIPGLMAGGPAMAGNAYIVGERGPELFVPSQSGTVVPNHKLGVSMAAPVTNVTVNGNADRSAIEEMRQMLAVRDRRFVADVAHATAELRRRSVFA